MNIRSTHTRRNVERDGWPSVSVVMPIRNEAEHLDRAVASVLAQDYPVDFDVCLAVGPSDDGTEEVANRLAESEPRVTVVANPAGTTPAGLNAAIAATAGEIVVRVDGHSNLSPGYVRRAVETMMRTGAVNVGGRQVPEPQTPFEHAVAAATTSWLGTGGATYRLGGSEGPVDTVYLGVFDRRAGVAVGWFDETLIRNQDYELNIRLRAAGGQVWFDPELWVGYRPRGSRKSLATQYFEYGRWKAEVLRRHPASVRLRQVIAPVGIATVAVATGAGLRFRPLLAVPIVYGAALMTVRPPAGTRRLTVACVLTTVHASWVAGLARGGVRRRGSTPRRRG